jgi:hypothetical protein
MNGVDLLACPFCGETPEPASDVGEEESNWFVGCMGSDCQVNPCVFNPDSEAEVIAAWNRRALPSTAGEPAFATIVDLDLPVGISEDALHTLMAHGMLRQLDGQLYRLAGGSELEADPGSAGVNVHTPGAVLAVLRAALSASIAPPPAAANPSVAEGVAVAPLKWDDYSHPYMMSYATLPALWIAYRIAARSDGAKVLRLEFLGNRTDDLGAFPTTDGAKAAAQADYEKRR